MRLKTVWPNSINSRNFAGSVSAAIECKSAPAMKMDFFALHRTSPLSSGCAGNEIEMFVQFAQRGAIENVRGRTGPVEGQDADLFRGDFATYIWNAEQLRLVFLRKAAGAPN